MSKITTLSTFYYGHKVTRDNQNIDFDEGGSEITAEIPINDYTMEEYVDAVEDAMNAVGGQTYTVTVSRITRKITISATSNFTLRTQTGSHAGTSAYPLMGYDILANKTGSNSYLADNGTGYEYRPQMVLFDYVGLEDHVVKESAVVNVSTTGIVQTLQWGDGNRMECNIRGIGNGTQKNGALFYENVNGLADARQFLDYLITKSKVEFMPDIANRNTKYDLILESSDADRNGTKWTLKNMARDWMQTGRLVFRKVIA